MCLSYVNKYLYVCCIVLILGISAVADISLDYYFGNEEPLRSADHILVEDCGTVAMKYQCEQKCGINHACLLGQCFCVKFRASSEAVSHEEIIEQESRVEENKGAEILDEDEEYDQEPPSYEESNNVDEELVNPALRHHIAHFCPNLNKARICIRKCMKLGLPAFCGKDHNCYCGHKYETSGTMPKVDPAIVHNQFRDLYEKYFGPKKHASKHHVEEETE